MSIGRLDTAIGIPGGYGGKAKRLGKVIGLIDIQVIQKECAVALIGIRGKRDIAPGVVRLKIVVGTAVVPNVITIMVFPCPWDAFKAIGAEPTGKQ